MEENDLLLEYIEKIINFGEYLARGKAVITEGFEKITFDRDKALNKNVLSIKQVDTRDELEISYYGELNSIIVMVELINDGDYVPKKKFDKEMKKNKLSKKDKAAYKILKIRLKKLITMIVMELYKGIKIPQDNMDVMELKLYMKGEEVSESENDEVEGNDEYGSYDEYDETYDSTIELPYPNEQQEDDEESKCQEASREKKISYLIYDINTKQFNLISDGEIVIYNVDISIAVEKAVRYLYSLDKDKKYAILAGDETKIKTEYAPTRIIVKDEKEHKEEYEYDDR